MTYDEAIDDTSGIIQPWASFESALMEVGGTDIPLVKIILTSKDIAKQIIALLLSGRILPHLHGHLSKVRLMVYDEAIRLYLVVSPEAIFASAQITLDGETIELNAAERADWLLSQSEGWGSGQSWDKREEYVRGLLRAARAAAATADAGAESGPTATDEARGTSSGSIQETT